MSTRKGIQNWDILLTLLFTVPVIWSEQNVALTGTAEQSADQDSRWTANKTIDNCINQTIESNCCSHTQSTGHTEAWLRVDLGQKMTIQYITIYYRRGLGARFAGYSLYVSNVTTHLEGILCHTDNSSLVDDVQLNPTHQCPHVARYVTVYNHRGDPKRHAWYSNSSILELCEVQVFGCPNGRYSNGSCNSYCSESCFGGNCNSITGSCFYCFPGMYGDFCEKNCSANCNRTCEKDSGHCIGCIPGKTGELCNTNCASTCVTCEQTSEQCFECVNGKYGDVCNFSCSDNCKGNSCMKDNGYCLECVPGKYGNDCAIDCSTNCKDKACMKTNGHCIECVNGKYSDVCDLDCPGNCKYKSCMKDNGYCLGCIAGKTGELCNVSCSANCVTCNQTSEQCFECVKGKHGGTCDLACPDNCKDKACMQDNGYCLECVPGKYGNQCTSACSVTCKDTVCMKTNGHCIECIPEKYGPLCKMVCPGKCKDSICQRIDGNCTDCPLGKHGSLCNNNCSTKCLNNRCDAGNGVCEECQNGYFGQDCTSKCKTNCTTCRQTDGDCTECMDGLFGGNCSIPCGNCERCMKDTGDCLSICASGYEGNTCQMRIQSPESPGGNIGAIVGVVVGLLLVAAIVIISVFFIKRHRQNSTKEDSLDDMSRQKVSHASHHNDISDDDTAEPIKGQGHVYVNAYDVVEYIAQPLTDHESIYVIPDDVTKVEYPARSPTDHGSIYVIADDVTKVEYPARSPTDHEKVYVNADVEAKEECLVGAPADHRNTYVIADNVMEDASGKVSDTSGHASIAIPDLRALVKTRMLNKAKAFKDEYESLPSGAIHEHNIGMLPENKLKNRFKTTFPYDHSRVILNKLDNDPHSDYINANYIDSVILPAEYIATQGPTNTTVDDLWRMIWQLKSGKIVMLTNLIEATKKKCAKYWPDEGEPMSTQHFSIVLDRERIYAFYVIRDITLTEKKTKSVRQIHQFHYTTWPDHGTPDPSELVVFHRRVKHNKNTSTGKMVVHCSAGIGRTGTFIALDALLKYGKESGMVDILGYIKTMRKDRVNMVQTNEQYIAIHNILIEAFGMPDTLIPRMTYHTTLNRLLDDTHDNQTKLWQEYQLTQHLKPTYTESDCKTATVPANRNKNKDPHVLAVDRFRPYLSSSSVGGTDYINAVAVPSYTSRTGYIVTQTPLEDTIVDLLTMIMDHNCDTIVIIEKDPIKWLPGEDTDKCIGSFTLKHEGGSSSLANTDFIDVVISNRDHRYDAKVRVFRMTGWDRDVSVPPDSSGLLQLLERVDSRRKSNGSKTTAVLCRDGYTQSGLFCCISNARDQMKIDEEVDLFQMSRQLLVRRPECITSYEQYQCCYNMIRDYLDTTDVYMN